VKRALSRRSALLGVGAALGGFGCSHHDDVIVKTGANKELSEGQIDADPAALLPGGAVGVLVLDAGALFNSMFGDKVRQVVEKRMPLPPSAGFEPKRDLRQVWLGFYSMQGADMSGVALGSFDRQKIEAAADGAQPTPLGQPLVKTTYAGRPLYTSSTVGFSVLTAKTALIGNDTGMRRALDRIAEGRAKKQLPPYIEKLVGGSTTPIVFGADFSTNPPPDSSRPELAFMTGLSTVALVGNFQEPGLNLAGTLSYLDAEAARKGAQSLIGLRQRVESVAPFLALLGIGQPVRKLEAQPNDKDVSFVAAIDGAAVAVLLDKAQDILLPR
jgi:hypothetical protein